MSRRLKARLEGRLEAAPLTSKDGLPALEPKRRRLHGNTLSGFTHVAVALLGEVGHVHTQAIHVALVPDMRLTAVQAVCTAERRAEALAAGARACLGGSRIRWWLQAMREKLGQSLTARAMPKLLLHCKTMLVMQEPPPFLIEPLQCCVTHPPHCHDARHSSRPVGGNEGSRSKEFCLDLVILGAFLWHNHQVEGSAACSPVSFGVVERAAPLPSLVAPQIPATAIMAWSGEPWARLSHTPRIRRLLVINRNAKLAVVTAPAELIETCPINRLAKKNEGANTRPIPLGHHLRDMIALKEALHILSHHIVILTAKLRCKPAHPDVAGGRC
mmetsp:Transcript_106314/g.227014  ORF Transcript_106314/g.227014 Transcript_106314/m.227014 type:complete len:329 (+) Transcript_106314:603-1589(+)